MKKLVSRFFTGAAVIAAGSASAADLGIYNKTPLPAPVFSWSGCYAGGQSGLGAGHTTWKDASTPGDIDGNGSFSTANTDMSGGLAGAQIGCDYQYSSALVFGLSGMMAASNITGTNVDQFNATWALRDNIDWYGSITGRAGYAVGQFLLYYRGGVAWGHNRFEIENSGTTLGTPSATRVGWTLGSGIEWAFAPGMSAFVEASYYSFGNQNISFPGAVTTANTPFLVSSSQSVETVQFGVNYHFWTR